MRDDRAEELDAAMAVMEEWTRAEPGFQSMTEQDIDRALAEVSRATEAEFAADKVRQGLDRERYDADREQARVALLEQESILPRRGEQVEELRAGRYSSWTDERRASEIAALEADMTRCKAEIERLASIVGDREDVVDQHGRLPRDRRKTSLLFYQLDRERDVRELRLRLPALQAALKASSDRAERSKLRSEIQVAEQELEKLLAVPSLTAGDMCSECPTPLSQHGWVSPPFGGPCPAWPGWAVRIREAREMLFAAFERPVSKASETPKPQPLATFLSGLPISDVIAKLTELQSKYPSAVVKRGRAGR